MKKANDKTEERERYTLDNCPPLFGQDVLAEVLGVSEAWCEKTRYQGTGPRYRKLGGAVRYTREDVWAYIDRNSYQSTSQVEPIVA